MTMVRTRRLAFGMSLVAKIPNDPRAAGTVFTVPAACRAIVRDARFYNAVGPDEGTAGLVAYSPDWSAYVTFGRLQIPHGAAAELLCDVVLEEGEHLVVDWSLGPELQYLITGAVLSMPLEGP